jgi:hypothetical protein
MQHSQTNIGDVTYLPTKHMYPMLLIFLKSTYSAAESMQNTWSLTEYKLISVDDGPTDYTDAQHSVIKFSICVRVLVRFVFEL